MISLSDSCASSAQRGKFPRSAEVARKFNKSDSLRISSSHHSFDGVHTSIGRCAIFVPGYLDPCAIFVREVLFSCAQFVIAKPTRAVSMGTPKGLRVVMPLSCTRVGAIRVFWV